MFVGIANNNFSGSLYVTSFIKAFFYILLSWILSLLFVFLLAKMVTTSGQSLSWYCKPYVLVGLYVLPGMLVMCGIHYWQATHFKVLAFERNRKFNRVLGGRYHSEKYLTNFIF